MRGASWRRALAASATCYLREMLKLVRCAILGALWEFETLAPTWNTCRRGEHAGAAHSGHQTEVSCFFRAGMFPPTQYAACAINMLEEPAEVGLVPVRNAVPISSTRSASRCCSAVTNLPVVRSISALEILAAAAFAPIYLPGRWQVRTREPLQCYHAC